MPPGSSKPPAFRQALEQLILLAQAEYGTDPVVTFSLFMLGWKKKQFARAVSHATAHNAQRFKSHAACWPGTARRTGRHVLLRQDAKACVAGGRFVAGVLSIRLLDPRFSFTALGGIMRTIFSAY